jgi:adenosylhomocysteine nucleosidase
MNCRIAIIAAMERELKPLVQDWAVNVLSVAGKTRICYEHGDTVVVFCGMGSQRAEQAARAVVEKYKPEVLVSAGVAGALIRSLKVGSVVLPNVIVDGATGVEYRCAMGGQVIGGGVLVSTFEIAGLESKAELVECFHALMVDMEAAGVVRVAKEKELSFRCVKAVSDEYDFPLPPVGQFVGSDGNFQTARFARWVAVRPQYWMATMRLGRNTGKAVRALCDWLKVNLQSNLQASKVVTLDGEFSNGRN